MIDLLKRFYRSLKSEGPAVSFHKAARWVQEFFLVCYATMRFRPSTRNLGQEGFIDFVFTGYRGLMKPLQNRDEIARLVRLVRDNAPETIIEIGTAGGGTLSLFCHAAPEKARIISVDLPYGMFGGGYPVWKKPLYKSCAKPGQKLWLIRKDSHEMETLDKVKKILGPRSVDFLFIDGDHTYGGVKKDFELYAGLVRRGGIVALHDIVAHPPSSGCDVRSFWEENKGRYRHTEIVEGEGLSGFGGIGVLYVD